jgi:hypothetical protein
MMSAGTLQLLSTLLTAGPEGATRQHLVAKADIAVSTFYRLIKPLLQGGMVVEEGQRYRLPLGNLHNFRFKLWHDTQCLWALPPADRDAVLDIATQAQTHLKDNLQVLWLVGSAASGTLTAASDLDFLALVKEDVLYHPSGQRSVNFVMMPEADFDANLAQADDFVLAALRSGLVLFDKGRAQSIYEHSPAIGLSSVQAQDAETAIARQRNRLLRYIEADAPDMAARALQAVAIKTAWRMLRTMNVLPPPKAQLVALCERYFGAGFAGRVDQALRLSSTTASRQLALNRTFEEVNHRFNQALSHLKTYTALPTAGSVEFNQLCLQWVQEFFPHDEVLTASDHPAQGIDILVRSRSGKAVRYAFDCVARDRIDMSMGAVSRKFERLAAYPHAVLLANVNRKLPILDRPAPFSDDVVAAARQHGIVLVTGLDLLQAHNRVHLEELRPDQLQTELLGGPPARRRTRAAAP